MANPTGINQYTKGGARLNPQASRRVKSSGMPKAVIRAAVPHKISVKRSGGVFSVGMGGGFSKSASTTKGALALIRQARKGA